MARDRQDALTSMRRVAPVVLCVLAFYAVLVPLRIEQHNVRWFVHLGEQFLTTSTKSDVIGPWLGAQSPVGYDGQYYFAVAVDPTNARYYMGGSSGYVYSRVFYPAAAYVVGLGSVRGITYAMLAINLLAMAAGTLALALWLRARGSPAWPAAFFGLFPGLVFTVFRDLTEPLAFSLVALGMLAFHEGRTRRLVLSAGLFALALLTRETVLPFALAAAAMLAVDDSRRAPGWASWRVWRRPIAFAAGACAPLLVWRQVVAALIGGPTQELGGSGWGVPFHGISSYWPFDAQHWLIALSVILPSLVVAAGAVALLVRRRAQVPAALVLANVLAFVVFLPSGVDVDYGAAGRAAIGVVLAAVYCVPALRELGRTWLATGLAALVWVVAGYLLVADISGLPVIDLVTL